MKLWRHRHHRLGVEINEDPCLLMDSQKAGPHFALLEIFISVLGNESSLVRRTFAHVNHTQFLVSNLDFDETKIQDTCRV